MGQDETAHKLSAYQIWLKVRKEELTPAQHKQLLVENKIIVPRKKPACPICFDTGEYHTGGSFGGSVTIHKCHCNSATL